MPIAAVPAYLGRDFADASPALRFGILLSIWTSRQDQEAEVHQRAQARSNEGYAVTNLLNRGIDHAIARLTDADFCRQNRLQALPDLWSKNDFGARHAWKRIASLSEADRLLAVSLIDRMASLARALPASSLLQLEAKAVAPFTTGLGNEHPLENGFAFLNPYGLPYLPGSGVKGVLRRAAQELADGSWGDTHGWSHEAIATLTVNQRKVGLSVIDVLFGREPAGGESEHVRGVLSFWDVIPQIAGEGLLVEVMTPHQSHYYQQKPEPKRHDQKAHDKWIKETAGSLSPHDSGQPTPISFLTVPPGSSFRFHVVCDEVRLKRLAPVLLECKPEDDEPRWKSLLLAAFEHAFQWLGFGAKTAVGYGAMALDRDALNRARQAQRKAAEEARRRATLDKLSENQRKVFQLQDKLQQRRQDLSGRKERWGQALTAEVQALVNQARGEGWTSDERSQLAAMLQQWLEQVIEIDWKEARKRLGLTPWFNQS